MKRHILLLQLSLGLGVLFPNFVLPSDPSSGSSSGNECDSEDDDTIVENRDEYFDKIKSELTKLQNKIANNELTKSSLNDLKHLIVGVEQSYSDKSEVRKPFLGNVESLVKDNLAFKHFLQDKTRAATLYKTMALIGEYEELTPEERAKKWSELSQVEDDGFAVVNASKSRRYQTFYESVQNSSGQIQIYLAEKEWQNKNNQISTNTLSQAQATNVHVQQITTDRIFNHVPTQTVTPTPIVLPDQSGSRLQVQGKTRDVVTNDTNDRPNSEGVVYHGGNHHVLLANNYLRKHRQWAYNKRVMENIKKDRYNPLNFNPIILSDQEKDIYNPYEQKYKFDNSRKFVPLIITDNPASKTMSFPINA